MKTPRTDGGLGDIDIPLLADPTHAISKVGFDIFYLVETWDTDLLEVHISSKYIKR